MKLELDKLSQLVNQQNQQISAFKKAREDEMQKLNNKFKSDFENLNTQIIHLNQINEDLKNALYQEMDKALKM